MLAVRLCTNTTTIGAITFCSRTPAAFDPDAQAVAAILATHAAIAIIGARKRALANDLLTAVLTAGPERLSALPGNGRVAERGSILPGVFVFPRR